MIASLLRKPYWLIVAAVGAMLCFTWMRFSATRQLDKLVTAVEDGKRSTIEKLVSDEYSDRWKHDKERLLLLYQDVRSQFISLNITLERSTVDVQGQEGTVTGVIRITGKGLGASVESTVNSWQEPFRFRWRKESWKPWSWRLTVMDHPEMELPEGYEPGMLKRMREGE